MHYSLRKSSSLFRHLFTPVLFVVLCMLQMSSLNAQTVTKLSSPDGHISMQLAADNQKLTYRIQYNGQQLATGNIGFAFGELAYGQQVNSIKTVFARNKQNNTLHTRGNHNSSATIKNQYSFKIGSSDGKTDFELAVNIYNNGLAYRFEAAPEGRTLTEELSHISLPGSTILWYQTNIYQYEGNYETGLFSQLGDSLNLGMPLTLRYQNGTYAAIMEADIFGFVGTYLRHYKNSETLDYTLAGPVETGAKAQLHSGWQIMTISEDLNGLVNNDILRDVCSTPDKKLFPQGEKAAWIRPGQSIWTWMSRKRDVTPENIRRFTDYAAKMKIPYNLIDDGWVRWTEDGKDHWQLLKEQVDYAKSKGVGIWVWQAYPPHNGTPGLQDSSYLHSFIKKCAALGVKGMKIDFIDAETQEKIAFYERAARTAAHYHLMVDFHGANKGTGMEYIYPNVLSQEGVRGLEQTDNEHWPFLNTVLPFTRYLSGPADYTPLSFAPYVSSTTLAHQVATAAIFTSPFLCLGADPQDLSQSIALPFVQQIPATWDETIVLKESKIGQAAVYARRKGTTWYLAILNGQAPRTLRINPSFLKQKKYHLTALEDQSGSRASKVTQKNKVTEGTTLQIELPAGGGYLGILKR